MSKTRERILDAAWALLARKGDAEPADVALEAGVSKALVFHHYKTVEGLHDAMAESVLRETQEGLTALAEDHPAPRDRLAALARALLAEPPEPPAIARRVLLFWLADDVRGEPRAASRDALVADFVAKSLREMRSSADAGKLASMILARWHGATVVYASGGAVEFEAEAERLAREIDALVR